MVDKIHICGGGHFKPDTYVVDTIIHSSCMSLHSFEIAPIIPIEMALSVVLSKIKRYEGVGRYNCSLQTLSMAIKSTLEQYNIDFVYSTIPCTEPTNPIYNDADINELVTIMGIKRKIIQYISLSDRDLVEINKLNWKFIHLDTYDQRCIMCQLPITKTCFELHNSKYDITCYADHMCIGEFTNLTYKSSSVKKALNRICRNPLTVLMESTYDIVYVAKNPLEYIYSYILNTDRDSITFNIKDIMVLCDKYSPMGLECATICWLYLKNYTLVDWHELKKQITDWNETYDKVWNINQLRHYCEIQNAKHLSYDRGGEHFVYKKYCGMELSIYRIIKQLNERKSDTLPIDDGKKIFKELAESKAVLNPSPIPNQLNVFDNVSNNTISSLTGGGGVGKTFVSSSIAKFMLECGYTVIQIAPTGKAVDVIKRNNIKSNVDNANVYTIHNMLYGAGIAYHETWLTKKLYFSVDECSMIDIELWYEMMSFITKYNSKILLIGDYNQIEPVRFGDITKDIFHMCNLIRLTITVRMVDKDDTLDRLLGGDIDYVSELEKLHGMKYYRYDTQLVDRYSKPSKAYPEPFQFLTYTNHDREEINNIVNSGRPILDVRPGDKIMILKNGYHKGNLVYYNGQTGIVVSLKKQYNRVSAITLNIDGNITVIEFVNKHKKLKLEWLICFANCVTIHKSQGDEYKNVCIVLMGNYDISMRLLYTALTRRLDGGEIRILCSDYFIDNWAKISKLTPSRSYIQTKLV